MPKKQALQPRRFGPTKPPVHLDHGAAAASACVVQEAHLPRTSRMLPRSSGREDYPWQLPCSKRESISYNRCCSRVQTTPRKGARHLSREARPERPGPWPGGLPYAVPSALYTGLSTGSKYCSDPVTRCRRNRGLSLQARHQRARSSSASFLNRLGHTGRRASQGSASTDSLAPQTCFLAWKRPQVSLYLWC